MTQPEAGNRTRRGGLVLIDGNSLLYRAFFALPHLTNALGEVTNAAYGFTTMLFKVIDEEQPEMIAVAFDLPGPTFRHEIFQDYKATRAAMPDELSPQIDMVREVLEAMAIPVYEAEGYEADDVIGTLAAEAERRGTKVLIVTGDLDELQLVSDKVSVMVTRRGISDTRVYDPQAVRERYGLDPKQLVDFRALRGDTSDNIPGVPGIGEKTAAKLVGEFGSLEAMLENVERVKPARFAAALEAHAEVARRAKELSAIVRDLPIEFAESELEVSSPDEDRLGEIFRRLDFRSLLRRLEGAAPTPSGDHSVATSVRGVTSLADELEGGGHLVIHPLAPGGRSLGGSLLGMAFMGNGEPAVVLADETDISSLLAPIKPLLESPEMPKVGHDLKRSALLLARRGICLQGLAFDVMIAAHLSNPNRRAHELSSVVSDYLQEELPDPITAGKADASAAAVAARHLASLKGVLEEELEAAQLVGLFRELEMPLIPVLVAMEEAGVAVDCSVLKDLSDKLGARAAELQADIHAIAGEEFNIASPAQLRHILFEKLGLPPDKTKRTKTGYSTAADVLAALSEYEIVAKILEYREVTKLKSTYVDALPPLVHPETGRVHTSFNQAVTATGRLSSTNPNLQNIPVRTAAGREIRRAFIAGSPGSLLLSADYSQIELRILAHITEDQNLVEVFRRDEDLHRAAAMEIFGVDPQDVTPGMRAFAKMVNFGIPYGISDFRLAREMGIGLEEARSYMERYFAKFPGVLEYTTEMPERARRDGYVVTLMGRRRPLPELRSRGASVRQAAERMAINTPMQGSAADIIKLAMLRVHDSLQERDLGARMLLQVHDELVFEVPESEVSEVAALAAECMSTAYQLRVPLKVDVKVGSNWLDMGPVS